MAGEQIGALFYGSPEDDHETYLLGPLRLLGYKVDPPLYARGDKNLLKQHARALGDAAAIVASDTEAGLAALKETDRPVVVAIAGDPIRSDLNLNPLASGGDVTGYAFDKGVIPEDQRTWETDSGEQRLCILEQLGVQRGGEVAGPFTSVAVIYSQDQNASDIAFKKTDEAGNKRPRKIQVKPARVKGDAPDFDKACQDVGDVDAIMQINDPVVDREDTILACTRGRPTLYETAWYVERPDDGGLAAYVPDMAAGFPALFWGAALMAHDVVSHHRERGHLPAMTVVNRKVVVNMPKAEALGCTVPPNGSVICGGVRIEHYTP